MFCYIIQVKMKKILCFFLILACIPFAGCTTGGTGETGASNNEAQTSEGSVTTEESTKTETTAAVTTAPEEIPPLPIDSVRKGSSSSPVVIACVGDSITAGYKATNPSVYSYPAQLQKLLGNSYSVKNFGKSTAYVTNVTADSGIPYMTTSEYASSLKSKPDVVIIMLGTNDNIRLVSEAAKTAFKNDYIKLVNSYKELPTKPLIYLCTPTFRSDNSQRTWTVENVLHPMVTELAAELDCVLIDIFSLTRDYLSYHLCTTDCLHPTNDGYLYLAKTVQAAVFEGVTAFFEEIVPTPDTVVYLSSKGTLDSDGQSPDSPVNSMTKAVWLCRGGGTIVVIDVCTLDKGLRPVENKYKITVTSVYGGTDYRNSGAKLVFSNSVFFQGDYEFNNINLVYSINILYICNYNNITFGDGIASALTGSANAFPAVIVGYLVVNELQTKEEVSLHKDCTLTINSGTFGYVRGGNRRNLEGVVFGSVDKNCKVSIIINGGEFRHTGGANPAAGDVVTLAGMGGGCDGEIYMEINGGTFFSSVYGIARSGASTVGNGEPVTGTLTLKITGGTFRGSQIAVLQAPGASVIGSFNVILEGGKFLSLKIISGLYAANSALTYTAGMASYAALAKDFTSVSAK